jgi:hypothetical protein
LPRLMTGSYIPYILLLLFYIIINIIIIIYILLFIYYYLYIIIYILLLLLLLLFIYYYHYYVFHHYSTMIPIKIKPYETHIQNHHIYFSVSPSGFVVVTSEVVEPSSRRNHIIPKHFLCSFCQW